MAYQYADIAANHQARKPFGQSNQSGHDLHQIWVLDRFHCNSTNYSSSSEPKSICPSIPAYPRNFKVSLASQHYTQQTFSKQSHQPHKSQLSHSVRVWNFARSSLYGISLDLDWRQVPLSRYYSAMDTERLWAEKEWQLVLDSLLLGILDFGNCGLWRYASVDQCRIHCEFGDGVRRTCCVHHFKDVGGPACHVLI